jgi:hypothetical protein
MPREVLMVGSVPLSPAASVFTTLASELEGVIRRLPDGEQAGWLLGVWKSTAANTLLEPGRRVPMARRPTIKLFQRELQYFQLKAGVDPARLVLGPYGVAENAIKSYAEFAALKQARRIPEHVRFQATVPGPLDCAGLIDAPKPELFRAAAAAVNAEIDAILAAVPQDQIAIQLDLAVEVEVEEFRRRPAAFDMPPFEEKDWTLAETAGLIAEIANRIPSAVELGFHLCSIWHIDQSQGQDNNVHVDWCNALSQRISRPIAYIHMPTIPEHGVRDFEPLARLALHPETKLFLGVLHAHDGIDGARRRVGAASQVRADFGIASFCGLGQPSRQEEERPHALAEILKLHREAAQL